MGNLNHWKKTAYTHCQGEGETCFGFLSSGGRWRPSPGAGVLGWSGRGGRGVRPSGRIRRHRRTCSAIRRKRSPQAVRRPLPCAYMLVNQGDWNADHATIYAIILAVVRTGSATRCSGRPPAGSQCPRRGRCRPHATRRAAPGRANPRNSGMHPPRSPRQSYRRAQAARQTSGRAPASTPPPPVLPAVRANRKTTRRGTPWTFATALSNPPSSRS